MVMGVHTTVRKNACSPWFRRAFKKALCSPKPRHNEGDRGAHLPIPVLVLLGREERKGPRKRFTWHPSDADTWKVLLFTPWPLLNTLIKNSNLHLPSLCHRTALLLKKHISEPVTAVLLIKMTIYNHQGIEKCQNNKSATTRQHTEVQYYSCYCECHICTLRGVSPKSWPNL